MELGDRVRAVLVLALLSRTLLAAGPSTRPVGGGPVTTQSAPAAVTVPTEQEIRLAIRDLNHPSPARRRAAVQRLAEWGPLAFDALGKVASGTELEPALLARDLLREMGEVLFIGARVRLEIDRDRVRWDEPVTLSVVVENPSSTPIVVPWPEEPLPSATLPADDVHQVSAMMDIADQLVVTRPDGDPLEARIDPIEHDTAVHRALEIRAGDHPPSHPLAPGRTERLDVRQFNRGWARYPLLEKGKYTVKFEYQPEWKNPAWVAQGFGRITSNAISIEVTEPAPPAIRQADRAVRMNLYREGGRIIGELENTWDRSLWLNLNIGGPPETHARLDWVLELPDQDNEPFHLDSDMTGPLFGTDRLREVAPGQKVRVSTVDPEVLLKRARPAPAGAGPVPVVLRYSQLHPADALRRNLREKGRRESIPTQLFSGSAISQPVEVAR
jgi:hypothetical protein